MMNFGCSSGAVRALLISRLPPSSVSRASLPISSSAASASRRTFSHDSDSDSDGNSSSDTKVALVLGSSGCLGSALVTHLSRSLQLTVIGADVVQPPEAQMRNDFLDAFLPLPHPSQRPSLGEITRDLCLGLGEIGEETGSEVTVDAIICASGGWEGDPAPGAGGAKGGGGGYGSDAVAFGDSVERMLTMNLYPVLAAGYAASEFMGKEGLFVAIGATAALAPTPGMAGYGVSKAAAHHYVQTVGAMCGSTGLGHKKKRREAASTIRRSNEYLDDLTAVAILPTMIDTPANRASAPKGADFSGWTKPHDIAAEIGKWIEKPYLRPHSGSLVKVFPKPSSSGDDGEGVGAVFHLVR